MTEQDPPQPRRDAAPDDPWGEVVAASGYDDGAAEAPIYLGRPQEPPKARAVDPLADFSEPGPAARPQNTTLPLSPLPSARMLDPEPAAAPRPSARPLWSDEDDVVTRAFEEHARSEPIVPVARAPFFEEQDDAFEGLLGVGADELVEAATASPIEGTSVARDNARPAYPWETSHESPVAPIFQTDEWDDAPVAEDASPYASLEPEATWGEELPAAVVLRAPQHRARTLIREVVETALLALLVFLAVKASFQNFKVDGNSMFPTLENGEFLIVNKLVYAEVDVQKLSRFLPFLEAGQDPQRFVFHGPDRGEIIVFRRPTQPETDLIKRVIGLPGDTVEIVDGNVFINGMYLEEPYIKQVWHYTGPKVTVPQGEYFVMGDHRDNSLDSRSATVGTVPKDFIIGKALVTYWPTSKIGLAPNESPHLTDRPIASVVGERPKVATAR